MTSVTITRASGSTDVSKLVTNITWSGDYQTPARQLEFGVLASPTDRNIPRVEMECGDAVTFGLDGEVLFQGWIVNLRRKSDAGEITVRCYDSGLRLKSCADTYQFTDTTPEAAVAQIARDFGLTLGSIAATGVKLTRNFVGQKLYDIMATMYTLASEQTGDKYCIRFDGMKLTVFAKKRAAATPVIRGKSNLMDLDTTVSSEKIVNRAVVYNKDGSVAQTIEDAESQKLYGVFQTMIKISDTAEQTAKAAVADGKDPTQKITVNNIGDRRLITGSGCIIQEPYTGVYGYFWIDSDSHTWKLGQYYNKLVVNFRNLMDEKSVGEG